MNAKKLLQGCTKKLGYELRDADYIPASHERKIYDYYLNNNDPVRTIFDVGANIGQTAIGFYSSFPDAQIYSFEPFAQVYMTLSTNIANLPTVTCHQIALGDSDTTMSVASETNDRSVINSLLVDKQNELKERGITAVESVVVRKGESFCAEHKIGSIDILKIDTEGFELPVLRGFGSFLDANVRAVLCEFCLLENKSRQTGLEDLQEYLRPRGFRLVSIYDIRHEADGAFHFGNALFIHTDHLSSNRRW